MTETATAAVLDRVGARFEMCEVDLAALQPHEVLVRIVAAGVCGTDAHVQSGGIPFPLPGVVGHEGAGIVESIGGAVTTVSPGDQVLLSFTSCGRCRNCSMAHPATCDDFLQLNLIGGRRADGTTTVTRDGVELNAHFFAQSSFSTRVLADERGVTVVSPDADLAVLAPLGCGIQTGAGAVFNLIKPEPGSTLVILGAGAVGLAATMAAKLSPAAHVIVVDLVESRLSLAVELGATHVVNSELDDLGELVDQLTGGRGADAIIDATGVTALVEQASTFLAPGGTLASIGAPSPGSTVALDVNHWLNGRRYIGVTEGDSIPQVFLPALAELVAQGRMPLERLITRFDFADINDAVAALTDGSVVKPVLIFPAPHN